MARSGRHERKDARGSGWARRLAAATVAAALGIAGLAPAASGAVGAGLALDPTSGRAGESTTATGRGFLLSCGVDLHLGGPEGELLATAVPDAGGAFSAEVTVPVGTSAGEVVIAAVGKTTGPTEGCTTPTGTTARATYTVLPGLVPRFVPDKPERTVILDGFSREVALLKVRQGRQVRVQDGQFASPDEQEAAALNGVLTGYPGVTADRLFDARSEEELAGEKRRLEARSGREQGDKNLYFRLQLPAGTDAEALIDELNALAVVELAYPQGLDAPPPVTPDWRPEQGYREAAPDGINADALQAIPGGRGQNVQVIDIEYDFNEDHEDLPTITRFPNGTLDNPFDTNHGTAVASEMLAVDNGFGLLGLMDQATGGFVNQRNTEDGGDAADAIDIAASNSAPGDVILLEMQTAGANGGCDQNGQTGCAPIEYAQEVYDAVVAAVAAGIIVVEAAGNGNQDLDSAAYAPTFGTRADSGAIIVGAGGAPGCTAPQRGRLGFSNYGNRVDVQGWGECVYSAGYGNLQGSSESNDAYRASFSGTSSASPIVASAAGILSSVAQADGDADGLTSTEARQILIDTGTAQDTSVDTGEIGPLPDLGKALADKLPPVASAGGPYAVAEGGSVALDATASQDPKGSGLTYAWDLDDDGQFDDATGATPTYDLTGQDGSFPVSVRVTDGSGDSDEATTNVDVSNAAPIGTVQVAPLAGDEGLTVTLDATVTDAGWLDPLTATVDWGDGAGPQPLPGALESTRPDATLVVQATHTYRDNGAPFITFCGRDDDTQLCDSRGLTLGNVVPTSALTSPSVVDVDGVQVIVVDAGQPVHLDATATDPGSDDLTYTWTFGDGTAPVVETSLAAPPVPDPADSYGGTARDDARDQEHVFASACSYGISVAVADDDGGSSSASLPVLAFGDATRTQAAPYWMKAYQSTSTPAPYTTQELECLLSMVQLVSDVFSEARSVTTTQQAYDVLVGQGQPLPPATIGQLDRELLAAWLNLADGGISLGTMVDSDGNGSLDKTFAEVVVQAEDVRLDPGSSKKALQDRAKLLERINRTGR